MADSRDNEAAVEDVVIARIVKARGIRGEVVCDIETDFPERFGQLPRVTVWMPDGKRLALTIEAHWFHKDRVVLKFAGYDTMTDAETLIGGRLVIFEARSAELENDEYFEYDLVDAAVVTSEGKTLGRVARVMRTGAASLLVVQQDDRREVPIPFVDEICTEVDVEARQITVDPPDGLLDL